MNRKLLILWLVIWYTGCSRQNADNAVADNPARISALLSQAQELSGISPVLATQKTEEATQKAKQQNLHELLVESWMLSGKISSFQGRNSESLGYYNQSLQLAQKIHYTKGICESKNAIGEILYDWGEYEKSYTYFLEVEKLAEANQYYDCLAHALNMIGKYYHTKGYFEKADELYQQSLNSSYKTKVYRRTALILTDMGKNYISLGKLSQALQYYLDAYKLCGKFNDKIVYGTVCDHLGIFYQYIGRNEDAMQYYYQGLACRKSMNNQEGIAKSCNNIGTIFFNQSQFDSAFYYFEHSLQLCKSTGYKKGTIKALTNMGKVCEMQHKPELAGAYLAKAYNLANGSGYDSGLAEVCLAMGNHHLLVNNTNMAITMFGQSLENLKTSNLYEIIRDDYLGLYHGFLSKKDSSRALFYHKLLFETEIKLLTAENNKQLAVLQISFDSEQKEKDNYLLRKDNELKEMTIKRKTAFIWLIILALATSLLLSILLYRRFYNKQKANRILESLNHKIIKQNSELEKLNAELEKANQEKDIVFSIITHELRNPLYWFQNLAEVLSKRYQTMKPEKVQKTLLALDESAKNAFHLMDNLLNWSRSRLKRITPKRSNHSLLSLVTETVKMYETILQHKEIRLQIRNCDHARIFADSDLFTCVLRNLVSNAIKYTPAGGYIEISCSEYEEKYMIVVSDSGKGIPEKQLEKLFDGNEYFSSPGMMQEKGSGLGLKICAEFVELNHGKIWVSSQPDKGTSFYFTVPGAESLTDTNPTESLWMSGSIN